MRCALSLLALGLAVSGVAAEPAPLTGDALSRLVAGRTVDIDTPLGTTVPIEFRDDGTLLGRAGAVAFYLGSMTDKGRWWVKGDRVCQKWTRWFDAEVSCMRFRVEGRRIHWSSDSGKSGTGTLSGPDPAMLRARAFALGGSQLATKPVAAATSVPPPATRPEAAPKVANPKAAGWQTRIASVARPVVPTGAMRMPASVDRDADAAHPLPLQAAPVMVRQAVLRIEQPETATTSRRDVRREVIGDEPLHPEGLAAMAEAVDAAAEFRWCQSALKLAHLPVAFISAAESADERAESDGDAVATVPGVAAAFVDGTEVPDDRLGCFAAEPALMRISRQPIALR